LNDSLQALVISGDGRGLPFAHLLWAGGVEVVYFSPSDEKKGSVSDDGLTHARSWRPHLLSSHFIVCDDVVMGRKCVRAINSRSRTKKPKVLYMVDVVLPQAIPVHRKPWWKFWSK
jgi:hypothetical protein